MGNLAVTTVVTCDCGCLIDTGAVVVCETATKSSVGDTEEVMFISDLLEKYCMYYI